MPEHERLRRVASRQNALVKELRRAFPRGNPRPNGSCAIESVRTIEEAIRSGLRFRAVFFGESAGARRTPAAADFHPVETLLLSDDAFRSAVATETPQGVAALVRLKAYKLGRHARRPGHR